MSDWRELAETALTDITAALNDMETNALGHLNDATGNLQRSVEALEDEDGA